MSAWRVNTSSASASAWSKWVSWCGGRRINPILALIESVLGLLTAQFKEGNDYRSINVYRSALSPVIPLTDDKSWIPPIGAPVVEGDA